MGGNGWKWGKMTEFPSISSIFASKLTFPCAAPAGPKRRQEFKGFGRDTCGAETARNVGFHEISWFKWNFTEFPFKIGFQCVFVNSWFLRFGTLDIPPPNHLNSCLLLRLARRGTRKPVFYGELLFSMKFRDFLWKSPDFHWICDFQWFPSSFPFVHPEYPSRTIAKTNAFQGLARWGTRSTV